MKCVNPLEKKKKKMREKRGMKEKKYDLCGWKQVVLNLWIVVSFFRDYSLGESDNCFKDSESWLFLQSIVIYFYVSKIRNLFHTFWISWFLDVALSRKTLFREWKLLSLWKISRSNSQVYVSNDRSAWNAILFFFLIFLIFSFKDQKFVGTFWISGGRKYLLETPRYTFGNR